uniref:CCHC-type domain-containing protein n=1 Tax=Lepisosteus oculatus TaxID=7918 RepID=W5NLU9_LEPOC
KLCEAVWRKAQFGKDYVPLKSFLIEPLFARELWTLTVHVFNTLLPERDVAMFLSRFVDIQGEGVKEIDRVGVWTGRRRYMVRLRPKPSGDEGVLHPPAFFRIGSNRGYLFYPGQPLTCKKCLQLGHIAANCPGGLCRRCGTAGHEAKNCEQVMTCDLCGSAGHMYRSCPRKRKSFADIVK